MYRYLFLGAMASSIVGMSACDDDDIEQNTETSTLQLMVTGSVSGEDLNLESQTYHTAEAAEGYRVTRTSFYLSDIRLIQLADGQRLETAVGDVAYLALGPDGTATTTFEDVPHGEYVSVKFNVGLTAEQDASDPVDYATGHPLARATEYWRDWGSYIFLKLEGKADTLANGVARYDTPFTYHIGRSAEHATEVEVPYSLIVESAQHELGLVVDVATLLGLNSSDPLSIVGRADHANQAAARIMANVPGAFSAAR